MFKVCSCYLQKWYGTATMVSAIGFHNVVKLLSKAKTTPDVSRLYFIGSLVLLV